MPFYNYRCNSCEGVFEVFHLMTEEWHICTICDADDVEKVPSEILTANKVDNSKVGDLVKKHIEEAKMDIRQEKKRLKGQVIK